MADSTFRKATEELKQLMFEGDWKNSLEKSRRVESCCEFLLTFRPNNSGHASSSVSFDANQLRKLLEDARLIIRNQLRSSGGSVTYLGVCPRR